MSCQWRDDSHTLYTCVVSLDTLKSRSHVRQSLKHQGGFLEFAEIWLLILCRKLKILVAYLVANLKDTCGVGLLDWEGLGRNVDGYFMSWVSRVRAVLFHTCFSKKNNFKNFIETCWLISSWLVYQTCLQASTLRYRHPMPYSEAGFASTGVMACVRILYGICRQKAKELTPPQRFRFQPRHLSSKDWDQY